MKAKGEEKMLLADDFVYESKSSKRWCIWMASKCDFSLSFSTQAYCLHHKYRFPGLYLSNVETQPVFAPKLNIWHNLICILSYNSFQNIQVG